MNNILSEDFSTIYNNCSLSKVIEGKILVTGATGFLMGYFVKYLIYLKFNKLQNIEIICTYRNFSRVNLRFNDFEISQLKLIKSDLTEPIDLCEINYFIHGASIASPKKFKANPVGVLEPNTIGLSNILKSLNSNKLKKAIFISTTGVNGYVRDKDRPNNESVYGPLDCTDIFNCYLESKRMGEMICKAWFEQYNFPISIIRPAITYGPGIELDDGRSYADFISRIFNKKNIEIYSNGQSIRNYLYVSDFILGLMCLVEKGQNGEAYNIASEIGYSINDLANLLVNDVFKELNLKVVHKISSENNFPRVNFRDTSVSTLKAKNIGWKERVDVSSGFKRTVDYYNTENIKLLN